MNINSFVNFNINSSSEEEQLTIMSFNIAELIGYGGITRKFKPEPFIDLINQAKPDVLAIQEFPNWIASPNIFIESITKKTGLTYFFRKGNSSLITFSKYPITKKEYVDYGIDVTGYLYTEVSIKGLPYQIYNFHLNSNKITQISKSFVKEKKINALHNRGTWKDIKTMLVNYKNAALKRCYNAFALNKKATNSDVPTILLGDLNDVPMSRAYHLLANEFSDAFESAGQGIGTTYQGKLPLLRIDHILYNHKLRAHSFESISTSISDHKAIKATLSLISSK